MCETSRCIDYEGDAPCSFNDTVRRVIHSRVAHSRGTSRERQNKIITQSLPAQLTNSHCSTLDLFIYFSGRLRPRDATHAAAVEVRCGWVSEGPRSAHWTVRAAPAAPRPTD